MRKVAFFSYTDAPSGIKQEWVQSISDAIDSGRFIGGDLVLEFEESWAKMLGVNFAVGVGNGLDGLILALRALEIGPGDLVAVPSHTFIATWNAVKLVGATPVGVDVNQQGLIDLEKLESLTNISCVIPVHMHGAMVDMARLNRWAAKTGTKIVEDASQAHLARCDLGYSGTLSDVGVFSLYPTKNLGALGDAGVITTSNETIASSIRSYANYGASQGDKYLHNSFGVNSRLDSIQAAALLVNLKYLESWKKHRIKLAEIYLNKIQANNRVTFLHADASTSVWHHFPVVCPKRAELSAYLLENGISTEIHYPNLAAREYEEITGEPIGDYPIGDYLADSILSLPISQWHSVEEIEYVAHIVNEFCNQS
jgi:dTDP-4-amino-4,6-dideoxygalactose transaminase